MKTKEIENLPIIITKADFFFPFQTRVIKFSDKYNIKSAEVAIKEYDSNVLFVIQKESIKSKPALKNIYSVGILCKVFLENKEDTSSYTLRFSGINRVKIMRLLPLEKCNFAEYKELKYIYGDEHEEINLFKKIILLINNNLKKTIKISPELLNPNLHISHQSVISFINLLAYTLSHNDAKIFINVLSENQVIKNLRLILELVEKEINRQKLESTLNRQVNENITKSQREFYIREKIKLLKKELNELSGNTSESDNISKVLDKKWFPKEIKDKIEEELKKLEAMPPMSAEVSVVKNYLDWLIKLPWSEKTKSTHSLTKIKNILEKNHYGLKTVKERIIEYLAVKIKTNDDNQGIILCLSGPPGVGKTSLAKSIAEATNRNFIKASLGGVKDESEIRGHRRTYIGSMPGRIIQGMKKAGTVNPLFLLDEIDKLSSDFRGDPSDALLEVLDPEQNSKFSDHYIEETYDLSNVLFIATANFSLNIPPALRDRLEIIELSSYTEIEKLKITKKYLIPKVFKAHGITNKDLSLPNAIVLEIIRHYTLESGVRNLEREIAKICRKVVVEALQNTKHKKILLTKNNLSRYLGIQKYDFTHKNKQSVIGVATGLAWTSFGGDILPIEATAFKGSGKIQMTGNLGNIMKESANISISYIKTNFKNFGIDENVFTKDIHVNAPEGAIPKDGPSAGVTLTTSIISLLKDMPVDKTIAMTGEMTLQGHVLKIGGLKEKLIAAARSKIKIVFIPKENVINLVDVPIEILQELKIIPVSNYKDIYKYLFAKKQKQKNKKSDSIDIKTILDLKQKTYGIHV